MLEGMYDGFIIISVVRISGDSAVYILDYLQQILAHVWQDILDTGGGGEWNGDGSGSDMDRILSVVII
jgi:hypothetical protein